MEQLIVRAGPWTLKVCTCCGEAHPLSYYPPAATTGKPRARCRLCEQAKRRLRNRGLSTRMASLDEVDPNVRMREVLAQRRSLGLEWDDAVFDGLAERLLGPPSNGSNGLIETRAVWKAAYERSGTICRLTPDLGH